jgi:hypothetical protein
MRCKGMHAQRLGHNLTIRISQETYEQIKNQPEVNWSLVLRAAIKGFFGGRLVLVTTSEGPELRAASAGSRARGLDR